MSRLRRAVIDTNVAVSAFVFRAGTLAWLPEVIVNAWAIAVRVRAEHYADNLQVMSGAQGAARECTRIMRVSPCLPP